MSGVFSVFFGIKFAHFVEKQYFYSLNNMEDIDIELFTLFKEYKNGGSIYFMKDKRGVGV